MKKLLLTGACLALMSNSVSANEFEVRIQAGAAQGNMSNMSGLHAQAGNVLPKVIATNTITGSPGTIPVLGIDANYFFDNNWGVNAGISYWSAKIPDSINTMTAAGVTWSTTFPGFTVKGYTLGVGPVYRWKDMGKVSPYVGLNLAGFFGTIDNTSLGNGVGNLNPGGNPQYIMDPSYGRGGAASNVKCSGFMPRVGADYQLDNEMSIGLEYRYTRMSCNMGSFRSYENGFSSTLTTNSLMLSLGFKL